MQKKNVLSYLENMIGKVLKINKDGPESRVGKLISVNKDLLSIKTDNNQSVFYQLKHIKSIIENVKLSSKQWEGDEDQSGRELKVTNFQQLLKQSLLQTIQINGGGPAHRIGKLIDIKSDYLVLNNGLDEVIYYQLEHIKSISAVKYDDTSETESDESSESSMESSSKEESNEDPEVIGASDFMALLKKMKHNWVVINGRGPENIQGILVDYASDHIILVHHDEVFRIYTYHIKNISIGSKKDPKHNQKDKDEKNDNDDKNVENQKDDNKNEMQEESNEVKQEDEKETNEAKETKETKETKGSKCTEENKKNKEDSGKQSKEDQEKGSKKSSSKGKSGSKESSKKTPKMQLKKPGPKKPW